MVYEQCLIEKVSPCLPSIRFRSSSPTLLADPLKETLKSVYREGTLAKKKIPTCSIDELFDLQQEIKLFDFGVREGNVSSFELMIICLVVKATQPKQILEIGTFDGTTTLQMALNAPLESHIHTLDLPEEQEETYLPVAEADFKFIQDRRSCRESTLERPLPKKSCNIWEIRRSMTFRIHTAGSLDLCFIDGGHSYPCVKSDTEKTSRFFQSMEIILWHDCDPNCPGVYRYLCELATCYPVKHINGTQLAILVK